MTAEGLTALVGELRKEIANVNAEACVLRAERNDWKRLSRELEDLRLLIDEAAKLGDRGIQVLIRRTGDPTMPFRIIAGTPARG